MCGSACRQEEKLSEMFLKPGDVLWTIGPHGCFSATKPLAALRTFALPVHTWVLQSSRNKIAHNVRNAELATEPFVERLFTFHFGRARTSTVGRRTRYNLLAAFACAFTRAR